MSRFHVSLPAPHIPGNAMLDTSGLRQAIQNYHERGIEQENAMLRGRTVKIAEAQNRRAETEFEQGQQDRHQSKFREQVKLLAGFTQDNILNDQDPVSRAQKWSRMLESHPDLANAPDAYRDPATGPELFVSTARGYQDPLDRQSKEADIAYKQAQTSKLNRAGGGFDSVKDRANVEEGLRKEYAGLAKPYFEVRDAYTRVESSAKDPSAAGDLALIFNYMKMLDPGSVVREGEFATAQNAAGVPDQVRNMFNRILSGERMNPDQRTDFVSRARQLYQGQERQYQGIQRQYRGISERVGADPRNTIIDFGRPPDVDALNAARQAIELGAPRDAVIKRLQENGIDPSGL